MQPSGPLLAAALLAAATLCCNSAVAAPDDQPPPNAFMFKACNRADRMIKVALVYGALHSMNDWTEKGWFSIDAGQCATLGPYRRGHFYLFARTLHGKTLWQGKTPICAPLYSFDRAHIERSCSNADLRNFIDARVDRSLFTYTFARDGRGEANGAAPAQAASANTATPAPAETPTQAAPAPTGASDHRTAGADTFMFKACNKTNETIKLALVYRAANSFKDWSEKGWFSIDAGACSTLGPYTRGHFYVFGRTVHGNVLWQGKTPICVPLQTFERDHIEKSCTRFNLRHFINLQVNTSLYAYDFASNGRGEPEGSGPIEEAPPPIKLGGMHLGDLGVAPQH